MLNNADSVLQKDDVKEAIEAYEDLFAGARTEVCTLRSRVAPSTKCCRWMVEPLITTKYAAGTNEAGMIRTYEHIILYVVVVCLTLRICIVRVHIVFRSADNKLWNF